jgi:hypothetical protein
LKSLAFCRNASVTKHNDRNTRQKCCRIARDEAPATIASAATAFDQPNNVNLQRPQALLSRARKSRRHFSKTSDADPQDFGVLHTTLRAREIERQEKSEGRT